MQPVQPAGPYQHLYDPQAYQAHQMQQQLGMAQFNSSTQRFVSPRRQMITLPPVEEMSAIQRMAWETLIGGSGGFPPPPTPSRQVQQYSSPTHGLGWAQPRQQAPLFAPVANIQQQQQWAANQQGGQQRRQVFQQASVKNQQVEPVEVIDVHSTEDEGGHGSDVSVLLADDEYEAA